MIIKDIAETLYYICFIWVAICWQQRATYMKRLEERGKLLEKLEEILSIFDILKQDIHFLLFSDDLNINSDEEFKIRDERYKKIKEKINNSIRLFREFRGIYLNYFIDQLNIIESMLQLEKEIHKYNLNINAFILCNENTETDISIEESSRIYKILEKNESIFSTLRKGEINNSDIILSEFESSLSDIIEIIDKIELQLLKSKNVNKINRIFSSVIV